MSSGLGIPLLSKNGFRGDGLIYKGKRRLPFFIYTIFINKKIWKISKSF